MRKFIWVVCAATALVPTQAYAWGLPPYEVDAGFNWWLNVRRLDGTAHLAPWYTYWPQEAHFQMPAPITSPYPTWPQPWPPTAPAGAPGAATPGAVTPGQPQPGPGGAVPPGTLPNLNPGTSLYQFPPAPGGTPAAYQTFPYGPQPVGYYYYQPPNYWYGR